MAVTGQDCAHCGLPLAAHVRAQADDGPVFCCFGCALAHSAAGGQGQGEGGQANLLGARLVLSGFFAMNLMIFATVNYARHLYPAAMAEGARVWALFDNLINWVSLLFTLPIVALLLPAMVQNAAQALKARRADADYLVLTAVLSALVLSTASTVLGRGPVYFESVGLVLVLISLGRLWEARYKVNMLRRLQSWASPQREMVLVEREGEVQESPLASLTPGDVLRLGPGDVLYADGVFLEGEMLVDRSVSTGESHPQAVAAGEELVSLTRVVSGQGRLRVSRVGQESFLGRMQTLMQQAQHTRTQGQRIMERLAAWFTPVLLLLGVLALWGHWRQGGAGQGVKAMLSVWLVGCPCALTLATPLAMTGVLSALARAGVLIKDMPVLEDLVKIRHVFFDKTRTLTRFAPVVAGQWTHGVTPQEAAAYTVSLEGASRHPIASALRRALSARALPVGDVREHPTQGLEGLVQGPQGERRVRLGQPEFVFSDQPQEALARAREMAGEGLRVVAGSDGEGQWLYGLGEALKPEAATVTRWLARQNHAVEVLSGDAPVRVQHVAGLLGVAGRGGLSPQDKLACVTRARGPVMMVGDGLNDAVALKAATVGVAIHCGADLVRDAARVLVLGNDLRCVPLLLRAAAVARGRLHLALAWVFGYNLLGVGLAVAGWLNPLMAALFMVASSATLTVGSLLSGFSLGLEDMDEAAVSD